MLSVHEQNLIVRLNYQLLTNMVLLIKVRMSDRKNS